MKNYTASITTLLSAQQVYQAITEDMSNWWTPMSGKFSRIGDQAKTDFGGQSYWSFEASVLSEFSNIELTCHDANHIHEGLGDSIRTEWLGTKLVFHIRPEESGTRIDFKHEGLVPELVCFDICKAGWDHYFLGSLKNYLDGKSGQPNTY
ncbi:SRPBCC domain-containing protein [Marinicella sp. W31]|uniref:SRPBCC family protein n=1 Tax=Marinicella sp. W31 TaxID=3023713 RepID=UPI00375743D7